jgi:hypothetical protein
MMKCISKDFTRKRKPKGERPAKTIREKHKVRKKHFYDMQEVRTKRLKWWSSFQV